MVLALSIVVLRKGIVPNDLRNNLCLSVNVFLAPSMKLSTVNKSICTGSLLVMVQHSLHKNKYRNVLILLVLS